MATTANTHTSRLIANLWREKFRSEARRHSLVQRKLGWVVALIAVGSIRLPLDIEPLFLLYLAPPVAIVFDLFIIAESHGIRRIGTFLRLQHDAVEDGKWEAWLHDNELRDPFSPFALTLSTLIIVFGSGGILWAFSRQSPPPDLVFYGGGAVMLAAMLALHLYSQHMYEKLARMEGKTAKPRPPVAEDAA